jgi:glycosyltransferase involved in cell wall biosynthesis
VIATAAGGVTEVVRDDENGLLVPIGDVDAFAAAIRRYVSEPELAERLRNGAAPSVARFDPNVLLAGLESTLERVGS